MSQYLHGFLMITDRRKTVPCTVLQVLFWGIRVTGMVSFLYPTPAQQLHQKQTKQNKKSSAQPRPLGRNFPKCCASLTHININSIRIVECVCFLLKHLSPCNMIIDLLFASLRQRQCLILHWVSSPQNEPAMVHTLYINHKIHCRLCGTVFNLPSQTILVSFLHS